MSCGKCMRKGPITSNGYLNFLREFRKKVCGLSPVETVKRGACAWKRLNCAQKAVYRRMGCRKRRRKPCRRPRKRRCGARRRPRRSCCRPRPRCRRRRPKRRRCGQRRKKCMCPGPLTNNGYLNFLRWYRKKYCGLKPNEAIRRGARRWCLLPQHKKDRFNRMACKVTKNKRRLNSPLCRRC